jgi:uncharacterized OsmC-like protein
MTQIARYAQFKKVEIKNVKGHIKFNLTMTGSVLAETIDAGSSVETDFQVESDADPEVIKTILLLARKGCWARQMIAKPTTFEDTLTLNGQTFQL